MRRLKRNKTRTLETINEIVYALDTRLLESGKEYLLLAEANKHLVKQGVFSAFERFDKSLKKLLEKKIIPHAYQTDATLRQWRIPLSEEGKKRKELFVKGQDARTLVPIKGVGISCNSNKITFVGLGSFIISIFGKRKKQGKGKSNKTKKGI